MDDAIADLDREVMKAFGRVYILTRSDGSTADIVGVLSREVQPAGVFEAVQSQTTFTAASDFPLQRNDRVSTALESWRIDRKLKDDGHLVQWSLHAD